MPGFLSVVYILILFQPTCEAQKEDISSDHYKENRSHSFTNKSTLKAFSGFTTVSINKCCPPSQWLNISSWKCQDLTGPYWSPILYSAPEQKLNSVKNVSFEAQELPNCTKRMYLQNDIDLWFNVLDSGSVIVGLNFWTIPVWLSPDPTGHCVDVTDPLNTEESSTVLVFCELEYFQLYLILREGFGMLYMTSAVCVLLTVIIYLLIGFDNSIHGWAQFSHVLAVFLFYFSESTRIFSKMNGLEIKPTNTCFIHAVFVHYLAVVYSGTSCVMNMDCLITFWKLKSRRTRGRFKKKLTIYIFFGWVIPILALSLGFFLHFHYSPEKAAKEISGVFEYAHYRCSSPIWEFVFRIQLLLLVSNFLSFVGALYFIIKHRRSTAFAKTNCVSSPGHQLMHNVKLFLKLFIVTGVGYALLAVDLFLGVKNPMGWIFIVMRAYSSLQGVVYLIIFGLHRKHWTQIKRKYPKLEGLAKMLGLCKCSKTPPPTDATSLSKRPSDGSKSTSVSFVRSHRTYSNSVSV